MSSSSMLPPAGLDPRPRLLIVGCSTRAAAWSAVRAGFRPVCADQFGDEDLRLVAEMAPDALGLEALKIRGPRTVSAAHWVVSDEVVPSFERLARLSAERQKGLANYLGSSLNNWHASRASCSDYGQCASVWRKQGLPYLQTRGAGFHQLSPAYRPLRELPPTTGEWIVKRSSGGGREVRLWTIETARTASRDAVYFQEYKPGQPMSAIFLGRSDTIELIGLTQQLIGDPVASPPWPFGYCGNIAPVDLPNDGIPLILQMGQVIATRFKVRGLFGLDFLWDGTTPWVCEVNPRYTASCELLELAYGQPLLTEHWACFTTDPPPVPPVVEKRGGGLPDVVGKLILYARRTLTAPDLSRFLAPRSPWTVPFLADVPCVGTPFEPGQPLCTVFATGRTADAVRQKLYRRAARARRWFGDAEGE